MTHEPTNPVFTLHDVAEMACANYSLSVEACAAQSRADELFARAVRLVAENPGNELAARVYVAASRAKG